MSHFYKVEVNGQTETASANSFGLAARRAIDNLLYKNRKLVKLDVINLRITRMAKVNYEYIIVRYYDKWSGEGWSYTKEHTGIRMDSKKQAEERCRELRLARPSEPAWPAQTPGKDRHRGYDVVRQIK